MLINANPASNIFEALALAEFDEHVYVDVNVYPDEQFVQFVEDEQIEQPAEHAVQLGTFVINCEHCVQNPVAL